MDLDFCERKERCNSTLDTHHVDLCAHGFVVTPLLVRFNNYSSNIWRGEGLAVSPKMPKSVLTHMRIHHPPNYNLNTTIGEYAEQELEFVERFPKVHFGNKSLPLSNCFQLTITTSSWRHPA